MAKTAWLLLTSLFLLLPASGRAQTYSVTPEASADVLTLTFPRKVPTPMVLRTGPRRVEILFPEGTKLSQPGQSGKGRHIEGLSVADNVLVVDMAGESFGFVTSPKGDRSLRLQVYYDPAGGRWTPPGEPAKSTPGAQAEKPPPAALPETAAPATPAAAQAPPVPAPPAPEPARSDGSSGVRGVVPPPGGGTGPAPAQTVPAASSPVRQPAASAPVPVRPASIASAPVQPSAAPSVQTQLASAPAQGQTPPQPVPAQPAPPPSEPAPQAPTTAPSQASNAQTAAPAPPAQPQPGGGKALTMAVPPPPGAQVAQSAPQPPAAPTTGQAPSPPTAQAPGAQTAAPAPPAQPQPGGGKPLTMAVEPPKPDTQAAQANGQAPKAPEAPKTEASAPPEAPAISDDDQENKNLLLGSEQARLHGDYPKAVELANALLAKPKLSDDVREEGLYALADAIFDSSKNNMAEGFGRMSEAYETALNFNPSSRRAPQALVQLGYLNLRQGNLPEARAYYNLLKNKYPLDERVPLIDLQQGQYFLDIASGSGAAKDYEKAVDYFKNLIQKYPESRYKMSAALGLARCYLELKRYDEADTIIDFIEKLQPRFYVENPVLRRVSADVAYKLGRFEKAHDDYLWFYNLVPNDENADLVLSRLGDVNTKLGKANAAREYYDQAIRLYPGKEGALMSMMRLAEQGVYDTPNMQEMLKVFESPDNIQPDQVYQFIVKNYPKSAMAPLALYKLALWRLHKKDYDESLGTVDQYLKTYGGGELDNQAAEAAAQAFTKLVAANMGESNYKRIDDIWRRYPFLAKRPDLLPDRERLAVALSMYYTGHPKEALAMAEPYLKQGPSENAQKALALCLTVYRENHDWQSILDAIREAATWNLGGNARKTLEFAQAMALEYTGDKAKSRLIWARLAADTELDPAKRAYAVYFQGRTALERGEFDKAVYYGQDAHALFLEAAKDPGKAQDAMLLVIEALERLGQYREAIEWCDRFAKGVPEGGPDWASNRLRLATLNRLLGDNKSWRSILENLRDSQGTSLYGKMAASELASRSLEERAGSLTARPGTPGAR